MTALDTKNAQCGVFSIISEWCIEFIIKKKHRLCKCMFSSDHNLMAYSSNIMNYIDFCDNDVINTGTQKIILRARSRIKILHFPQNTLFDKVTQNLGKSVVFIQVSGVEYYYKLSNLFMLDQIMLTSRTIVTEVVEFVTRAHSLKNPICTCNVNLQPHRILDYGLCFDWRRHNNTVCLLLANKSPVSTEQIQNEIRIPDIMEAQVDDQSVFELLKNCGLLDQNTAGFWTLLQPQTVNSISSLHNFIYKNKMGVDIEDSRIQYPQLFSDIHILQQKNTVILLKDLRRIFYNSIAQKKCDEDICKIWQKSK